MTKKVDIWREPKTHIAGDRGRPLCGASANALPKTVTAHDHVPPSVTCERCRRSFDRKRRR